MTQYAAKTSVSAESSRAEIEKILERYRADEFAYASRQDSAVVQFRMNDRMVRFTVDMPDRSSREFWQTDTGRPRKEGPAFEAWQQAKRQRWRALKLVIQAKLEAVETGIVSFESEFGMHFILPNGSTVADSVLPAIQDAYESGQMPASMSALGSGAT